MSNYKESFRVGPWVLLLCAGILTSSRIDISLWILVPTALIILAGLWRGWRYGYSGLWTMSFAISLFVAGTVIMNIHRLTNTAEGSVHNHIVEVVAAPDQRGKWSQVEVESVDDSQRWIAMVDSSIHLKRGDVIALDGQLAHFQSPVFPYQFNERIYAATKGWSARIWVKECRILERNEHIELHQSLLNRISSWPVNQRVMGIYKAMLLGDKSDLSRGDRNDFADSGIVHILAVSGLHVGLMVWIFRLIFERCTPSSWKWIRTILILTGVWTFALLSGLSASVLRASILFSLIRLSKTISAEGSASEAVWMAAFLILIWNPYALYDLGFQLSFAAVFGIIYGHGWVSHYVLNGLSGFKLKVAELLSVSAWAQLATMPLTLYYFHRFPNYFLFANLILLLAVPILLIIGLITLCLDGLMVLPNWYWKVIDGFVNVFFEVATFIGKLPYAVTDGIYLSPFRVLVLILALVAFVASLHLRKAALITLSPALFVVALIYNSHQTEEAWMYEYSGVEVLQIRAGNTGHLYMSDTSQFSRLDWPSRHWRKSMGVEKVELHSGSSFEIEGDTLYPISISKAR